MPKNIVICCDGTGDQVSGDISNVMKLFRIAEKGAEQRVFYDPGVGTIGDLNPWARVRQAVWAKIAQALGYGLDDNILASYRFLMATYEPGDTVFLFGFSRGAYTVRALAGFVHSVGLLNPDQANIANYALTAYKRSSEKNELKIAWEFGRITSTRQVTIHFVGVWDTVASVIVPRPDRLYLPSLQTLPYTRTNPSVRAMRHAIAIDERRRLFRVNHWAEPQPFIPDPITQPHISQPQDIKQIWFAGVHGDVGGGYPEAESGLAKIPLIWMVSEARAHGLLIHQEMFDHLAYGTPVANGTNTYVPPNPFGKLHRSLHGPGWWLFEILPKSVKWREWKKRPSFLGWYLPWGEPRFIPTDARVDASVAERMARMPEYDPPNVPPLPPLTML